MNIIFVPLYIKYLGVEAYGLIGLFVLLQTWLTLLDAGLAPTLSREMARFSAGKHDAIFIRDLLRSIEIIVFSVAILIVISIFASSNWLATDWLNIENISKKDVVHALCIMGVVLASRFIENIYRSTIIGLEKQVVLNVVEIIIATCRGIGAVLVLIWVSPTIEAFFIWQAIISILSLVALVLIGYNYLPDARRKGRFSIPALQKIWNYAQGILGITFVTLCLTQVDKVLLSKYLSLENFGIYSFAVLVSSVLTIFSGPITQAFLPRLCKLVKTNDQSKLIETYHLGAQLISVILGSAAAMLFFFVEPILLIWTGNADIVEKSSLIIKILVVGNMLHSMMWIPFALQLAYGWTSLALIINFVALIYVIPTLIWVIPLYGAQGAAWVWLSLSVVYVLIGIHFMYRRLLISEKWRWYFQDVAIPLISALFCGALLSCLLPIDLSKWAQLTWIMFAGFVVLFCATMATSQVRQQALKLIKITLQTQIHNYKT